MSEMSFLSTNYEPFYFFPRESDLKVVQDINVVGDKMTRNGDKMTISKSCIFFNRTDFSCRGNYTRKYSILKMWKKNKKTS